jgi:hypothetical protein
MPPLDTTNAPPAPGMLPHTTQRLMAIMEELTALMQEEAPLITERNSARHAELVKRKQELMMDYQAAIKMMSDNPQMMASLPVAERARLKQAGATLDEVSRDNAKAIRVAYQATERLLAVIMEETRKDLHKESGYSGNAVFSMAEKPKAPPVAYSQRV